MVTRRRPEDLVENVKRFQTAAFAGTGLDSTLAPPASEEELARAEEQLGFSLPEELKSLYRFCAGGYPLGSDGWFELRQLVEHTETGNEYVRQYYRLREEYPASSMPTTSLDEGPGDRSIVVVHGYPGSDVMLEVDQNGSPGRVWSYSAHQVDAPFRLFANSLGEYWANLAYLAEAGCYQAYDQIGVSKVKPRIKRIVALDKKFEAGLSELDLGLIRFYA